MKRIITLFFIILLMFCGLSANAQGQFSPLISKMENSLFGINYDSQNDDVRLKRIEEVVYGQSSSKPVQQRVEKLRKDLAADVIGQEIKPKKDTFAEDDSVAREEVPKADSNVNYPMVNMLEDEVFHKEYKTTEINKRLSNLEQQSFHRVYSDDLNTRVDRLKAAILANSRVAGHNSDDSADSDYSQDSYQPNDLMSQNMPQPDDYFSTPNYNRQNSVLDGVPSSSSIQVPLSALEKSVLRKSFPDDPTSNRLSRLESKIFNTSFGQDDDETRLDRLSSAYRAQKSSKKYDSNKMSQHMSTAVQIGAMLLMVLAFVL